MLTTALPFDLKKASELLRDPETAGTTILSILLAAYGDDVFNEDVLEIYARINEDFNAQLTEEGENKLNALLLALESDAFYDDPLAFRSIALALYDGDIGDMVGGYLEDITVPEILWAIYEVGLLREEKEFSEAVNDFIEEQIQQEAEDGEGPEGAQVVPYYQRFIEEMKSDLRKQLSSLGVDRGALMQI